MDKNCILTFVVGVSGVGKTQMIKRFVAEHHEYIHLEASKLIKQAINAQTSEQLRLLPREKILKNQYLLLQELTRYKQQYNRIILDGHLLISNDKEIIPIPLDIVKRIEPYKIILIEGDPNEIFLHRLNDLQKKYPKQTIIEIEKTQNFLEKITIKYCKELKVDFNTLHFYEDEKFRKLLRRSVNV